MFGFANGLLAFLALAAVLDFLPVLRHRRAPAVWWGEERLLFTTRYASVRQKYGAWAFLLGVMVYEFIVVFNNSMARENWPWLQTRVSPVLDWVMYLCFGFKILLGTKYNGRSMVCAGLLYFVARWVYFNGQNIWWLGLCVALLAAKDVPLRRVMKAFLASGVPTLALVQASSELGELKRYVENGEFLIEASDLGVVNMCAERKLPFVAGHALNCYNAVTLKILLKQGMMRWCMPVELSRDWLVNLLNQCDELGIRNQFEVEVLSYGHLPLAYSARCFTARSEDRPKDECETCCIKYPNGRNVLSQENQQVFVLNGIQTMSGYVYNLGNELASMQGLVDVVRLSPQGTDTFAMLDAFRANENGAAPLPLTANSDCNGYWRRLAGLELQA